MTKVVEWTIMPPGKLAGPVTGRIDVGLLEMEEEEIPSTYRAIDIEWDVAVLEKFCWDALSEIWKIQKEQRAQKC